MNDKLAILIGFSIFIAILFYMKVPSKIAAMLDARANRIRAQLDEAREAREEAQTLLASFERKQADVQREADEIVKRAKAEATAASEQAQADLQESIARKLCAAEERIAQAESGAMREVRSAAASAATAAAREAIAGGLAPDRADAMLDDGIATIGARLN